MDAEEMKIVQDRISSHVPEHVVNEIFGYIPSLNISKQELIRLAYGPDNLIRQWIQTIMNEYLVASQSPSLIAGSPPISPTTNHHSKLSDPSLQCTPFSRGLLARFRWDGPYLDHQLAQYQPMNDLSVDAMPYDESLRFSSMDNLLVSSRQRVSGFPNRYYNSHKNGFTKFAKICRYFERGNCRHGRNCKFLHRVEHYFPIGDDQSFLPGSLKRLEAEITNLLISRRGSSVSIASLPTLYYEKYGKTLQAEGYLTESQRHGKVGYSLTKFLTRLTSNVRLIERPHGQHDVVLADNIVPYMELRGKKNDPGLIVSGSRHIYMTFPAESTFTEEDVFNYFSKFGQVQEVRIPCQHKRMFGFVTFASAEIVKTILSMEIAHFVCDARVLVKPYREKSKNMRRNYRGRFEHAMHYSRPITFDLEFQAKEAQFPSVERVNHLILKSGSTSGNNSMYPINNFVDQESNQ